MRNGMWLLLFSEANGRGRRFPLASVSLDEGDASPWLQFPLTKATICSSCIRSLSSKTRTPRH